MAGTSAVPNADAPMFASAPMQLIPQPVIHSVLLPKVSALELLDSIQNWIVSFLTGRQQMCYQ